MADMATRIKKNIYYVGNHEAFVQAKEVLILSFQKGLNKIIVIDVQLPGIKTKDF